MKKEKMNPKYLALIFGCLFAISLMFNIAQWDMHNQLEILKDAYKAEASVVVDSITIPLIIPNEYIKKQDLFNYIKECHNDKKQVHSDHYWIRVFPGYDVYNEMWNTVYLHKTPTIEGFAKWYNKKENKR